MKYGMLVASYSLLGAAEPPVDVTSELLKLGVLGTILLMLLLKDRERQAAADKRWEETNTQLFSYLEKNTKAHGEAGEAIRDLTRELRRRPCIKAKEPEL